MCDQRVNKREEDRKREPATERTSTHLQRLDALALVRELQRQSGVLVLESRELKQESSVETPVHLELVQARLERALEDPELLVRVRELAALVLERRVFLLYLLLERLDAMSELEVALDDRLQS